MPVCRVDFLAEAPRLLGPLERERWLRNLGWRLGRVVGSVKHRQVAY